MAQVLNTTFKLKRGLASRWIEVNPVLAQGEPGFILDENRLKIGDGITAWNDLPYIGESNVFSAPTIEDFPIVGANYVIYKAEKEKKIYQWNEEKEVYEELSFDAPIIDTHAYEVFSKPEGALVNIQEDEIRVMCGRHTDWHTETIGSANPNVAYIGLKIFAPSDDIYSFKEDLNKTINNDIMHYFTDNESAGIDENGRKYSIIWLPVAEYDNIVDVWMYYGAKSSIKEFFGWDYCVEWYDTVGAPVAANSIRINLSNESCHYINEPYYMASINVNKLTQDTGDVLILYGGSAVDNI